MSISTQQLLAAMAESFPASSPPPSPSLSPSTSPEMTQIRPFFSRRVVSLPSPRTIQEASPDPPTLPPDSRNDLPALPRVERRRTPVRPRLGGSQSAPNSATPIRKRKIKYSSPAVLRTSRIRNNLNDISSPRIPGSFPEFTFSRSPSPTPNSNTLLEESDATCDQLSTTPSVVDDRIRKRVREPLTAKQASGEAKGYVYIFEAKDHPGILKIGSTDRTVTERKQEIEQSCGRALIEHYRSDLLPFAQRAEKLCHDMLSYYRRPYACTKCTNVNTELATHHEEWFEVPLEIARHCIDLWTNFLRAQPYNLDGKLSAFWRARLGNTAGCSRKETHRDHHLRHRRWNSFVSASLLARGRHRVSLIIQDYRSIEFYRKWFMVLLLFSLLMYILDYWIGDWAPILHVLVSLGYFVPAKLIQGPKRKAVRVVSYI